MHIGEACHLRLFLIHSGIVLDSHIGFFVHQQLLVALPDTHLIEIPTLQVQPQSIPREYVQHPFQIHIHLLQNTIPFLLKFMCHLFQKIPFESPHEINRMFQSCPIIINGHSFSPTLNCSEICVKKFIFLIVLISSPSTCASNAIRKSFNIQSWKTRTVASTLKNKSCVDYVFRFYCNNLCQIWHVLYSRKYIVLLKLQLITHVEFLRPMKN